MTLTKTTRKILLVQNARTDGDSTKRYLEGAGYSIVSAGSGVSALSAARQQTVDLILIDASLPDMDGGDLCRRFRLRDATRTIPIIQLTANGRMPSRFDRAAGGPDAYLPKPYAESELEAKITAALRLRTAGPPEPDRRPEVKEAQPPGTAPEEQPLIPAAEASVDSTSRTSIAPAGGQPGTAAASGAVGDEVVDPATGLFGKKQFEAMFSKEFKRSVRFKQQMSCMLIDLDGRKIGRQGDAATLRAIIGLVQQTIREVDTAAWWTGEVLIVLLPNTIRNDAVQAAARIVESVANHPFSWSDSSKVTLSIGVAGLPDRKIDSAQKLVEAAAAACKRAGELMLPNDQ